MVRFILPVKALHDGKTRLHVNRRADLVAAMLRDTLTAVVGADLGPVILVSPDVNVAQIAEEYRVGFLWHAGNLNAAIAAALTDDLCVAVLPDLPSLRPVDLASVVAHAPGFVADTASTGTTIAAAYALTPRFGPGSASSYGADGLTSIPAAATARRDVDTVADLRAAIDLGVGPHTTKWLAASRGI